MTLQVKRFYRNDKQKGVRDWWNGVGDPVEFLDMKVNEFCKEHDVKQILHFPVTNQHNQYFVVIYEEAKK